MPIVENPTSLSPDDLAFECVNMGRFLVRIKSACSDDEILTIEGDDILEKPVLNRAPMSVYGYFHQFLIGLRCWYKDPPVSTIILGGMRQGSNLGYCLMRGSLQGIALREGSGRKRAYNYYLANWAGKRFGRWCLKSGSRVLVIENSRKDIYTGHSGCNKVMDLEFRWGLAEALGRDTAADVDFSIRRMVANNGDGSRSKGAWVFANLTDASKGDRYEVYQLMDQLSTNYAIHEGKENE